MNFESVGKLPVVGESVVGGFNKTLKCDKKSFIIMLSIVKRLFSAELMNSKR